MNLKIALVTTSESRPLLDGLRGRGPAERILELVELDLDEARRNAAQAVGCHMLVFAVGRDRIDDARAVASDVQAVYEVSLPYVLIGQGLGYPALGRTEHHLDRMPATYWDAAARLVEVFASTIHHRIVLIDDNLKEFRDLPLPYTTVAKAPAWIVPILYAQTFERRNRSPEREYRRCLRTLCRSNYGPVTVLLDIQLGTAAEGAALATELLFSDAATRVVPISALDHQNEFDRAAALLVRVFGDRLRRPTEKRVGQTWGDYLEHVTVAPPAIAAETETSKIERVLVRPAKPDLALRASLLTLLGPEFPWVIERVTADAQLEFVELGAPQPSQLARATDLARELAPDLAHDDFVGRWAPNYLAVRSDRRDGEELVALLPNCVTKDGATLRDILVCSLRGLTVANDWRPNGETANAWIDVLLAAYYPDAPGGPLKSVLDKALADDIWRDDRHRLGTMACRIARQFGTLPNPDDSAGKSYVLAIVGALHYARMWTSTGKEKNDGRGAATARFKAILEALPVAAGSVWGQRGHGRALHGQFDDLVAELRGITKGAIAPWPGPEPYEILVQLTLPLL